MEKPVLRTYTEFYEKLCLENYIQPLYAIWNSSKSIFLLRISSQRLGSELVDTKHPYFPMGKCCVNFATQENKQWVSYF